MSGNSTPKEILVLHGPNLNLLGEREPELYGTETLAQIDAHLNKQAQALGLHLNCLQSNHEGELIDAIQEARNTTCGLIINPGGYSHTSVALRDTLLAYPHPAIEVHLTNIHRRESFRRHSYVSGAVTGVICGVGPEGYRLALFALVELLRQPTC